eukprot:3126874-Rhodomonas_salina.2
MGRTGDEFSLGAPSEQLLRARGVQHVARIVDLAPPSQAQRTNILPRENRCPTCGSLSTLATSTRTSVRFVTESGSRAW